MMRCLDSLAGGRGEVIQRPRRRSRGTVLTGMFLFAACACGRQASPIGPTPDVALSPSCRDVASVSSTIVTFSGGFQQPPEQTRCSFDRTTARLACTFSSSLSTSQGGCLRTVNGDSRTDYGSISDFVDEAAFVGLRLATRHVRNATAEASPICGIASQGIRNDTVYRFDGQKRLTGYTNTGTVISPTESPLGSSSFSFLTWDAQGRPTSGSSTDMPGGSTITQVYDDVARTVTATDRFATTVERFDANGNAVGATTSSDGGVTERVTTVHATQRVCK
jgi:hypothetical protein